MGEKEVKNMGFEDTEMVLAIDPGLSGGFIWFDGGNGFEFHAMPLKNKEVDFKTCLNLMKTINRANGRVKHIYLERAIPFAMGSKAAFNYGRGFAALEIAIMLSGIGVTYVEPAKWTKEMHAGISGDLKPKAKSLIAVERLYPKIFKRLPRNRNGKVHDGAIDALLIAGYGLRTN